MPTLGRFHYLEALPKLFFITRLCGRRTRGRLSDSRIPAQRTYGSRNSRPPAGGGRRATVVRFRPHAGGVCRFISGFSPGISSISTGSTRSGGRLRVVDGGYIAFALFRHAARHFRGLGTRRHAGADAPQAAEDARMHRSEERGAAAWTDVAEARLRRDAPINLRSQHASRDNHGESRIYGTGAILALMSRPDATPVLPTIHCRP